MQLARGATPTESGLLTIPMIAGVLLSSAIIGQVDQPHRQVEALHGRPARSSSPSGLALMGTIRYDTNYCSSSVYMFIMGAGVGMVMQNLVLVVQNAVEPDGRSASASASVAFFRSLGGTIGVSVMGAVLGTRVADARRRTACTKLGATGAKTGAGARQRSDPRRRRSCPARSAPSSSRHTARPWPTCSCWRFRWRSSRSSRSPSCPEPAARHEDVPGADRRAGFGRGDTRVGQCSRDRGRPGRRGAPRGRIRARRAPGAGAARRVHQPDAAGGTRRS